MLILAHVPNTMLITLLITLRRDNASNYELVTKKGQMMGSLLCSSSSARDKSEMRFINGDMDPCDKSPAFQVRGRSSN